MIHCPWPVDPAPALFPISSLLSGHQIGHFMVVVGKHFYVFAYCGLVVESPHVTVNILFAPLPTTKT